MAAFQYVWFGLSARQNLSEVCKHELNRFYSGPNAGCWRNCGVNKSGIWLISLPGLRFQHWTENKRKRFFTHQVAKLDGGEASLDERPQAPEEVGRQGEPAIKDSRSAVPWILHCVDTIGHFVLSITTAAVPVDLHVELLLHLHLVVLAQAVKLWVWLAQVALEEVKLKGRDGDSEKR